jgi:hypothetical protein
MTSGTLRLNKSPDGVVHVFRKREPELGHVRKHKNWIHDALGEKESRKWLCGVVAFRASKRDSYLLLVFFCSCIYYTALTICLNFPNATLYDPMCFLEKQRRYDQCARKSSFCTRYNQ